MPAKFSDLDRFFFFKYYGSRYYRYIEDITWSRGDTKFLFHSSAWWQEPIARSEQLPCAHATAFSRISLFLERFWREFWISFKFDNRSAKPTDLKMIIFLHFNNVQFSFLICYASMRSKIWWRFYFRGKMCPKICLKINWSVKRSKNAVTDRPSMGVARSDLWAPSGATSLRFFWFFFVDDKTSEPEVFCSWSLIPRAHFETSLVMVSYCGKRCDVISSRLSGHFWVKMHVFSTSFFAISAMPIMPIRSLSANSLSPVLPSLDSTDWRGTARSLWNSWLGWPSYQPYSHSLATRETMASDPEGQLSDQSDIPANMRSVRSL